MDDLIAYCGLNCAACDAYLATLHNDQALRERTAKLWAELNNAPILPEHINCQGCRTEGVKTVFCDHLCGRRHLRQLPGAGDLSNGGRDPVKPPGSTGKSQKTGHILKYRAASVYKRWPHGVFSEASFSAHSYDVSPLAGATVNVSAGSAHSGRTGHPAPGAAPPPPVPNRDPGPDWGTRRPPERRRGSW